MRPQATSVCGLKLLVYDAVSYAFHVFAPVLSLCGLNLLVYDALSC
jgi:hypothetical protein